MKIDNFYFNKISGKKQKLYLVIYNTTLLLCSKRYLVILSKHIYL